MEYAAYILFRYIPTPLEVGDIVNICDLNGDNVEQGKVIRADHNYMGMDFLHKIYVQAFRDNLNTEFDEQSGENYFTIVDQCIYD